MSLYFGTTEITKIRDLVPQSGLDITDLWFGETNVYTVWATYEGTLPATINTNGDDMRQYQIYGNTGGVGDDSGTAYGYEVDISVSDGTTSITTPIYIGDTALQKSEYVDYQTGKVFRRTAQLFDKSKYIKNASTYQCTAVETQTGIEITSAGNDPYVGAAVGAGRDATRYKGAMVEVDPEETYTISASALPKCYISYIDADYMSLSYNQITLNPYTFTTPANCNFILLRFGKQGVPVGETFKFDNIVLLSGGTAVQTYIPYLQPTDPPVSLPALPTCDGATILDYAGAIPLPEKVLLKYRKEGY